MGKTEKKKQKEARSRGRGHQKKVHYVDASPETVEKVRSLGLDRGYWYDDKHFHSSYELVYYVWLESEGKKFVYRPDMKFDYVADNGTVQEYNPCFLVEGKFYDIRTDQFFDEDGRPYNSYTRESWQRKYDFLVSNGVTVLRESDLKLAFEYVKANKGKWFLKDARIKAILGKTRDR